MFNFRNDEEVAVLYFRTGYSPSHYNDEVSDAFDSCLYGDLSSAW